MAALNRRDIEMIFRADTDKATRPIVELGKATKATRGQLESLIDKAQEGEVSMEGLADATRDLKKVQDELGTARSLLTSLNSQVAAVDKAQKKYDDLTARVEAAKAAIAGAEKPTKAMATELNRAEKAQTAAAEALGRVKENAQGVRDQVESILGPIDNLGEGFKEIANISKDVARQLGVAGEASTVFQSRIAKAAATADDMRKFQDLASKSPISPAAIEVISQYEDRVQRLKDAERDLASQQRVAASEEAAAKAKQRADLDDLIAGNKALEAEIAKAAQESARIEAVNGYRKIADDARAAIADVSRFGVAEDEAAANSTRLARAIEEILSPSTAANRTLEGLESRVADAAKVLDGGKKSLAEYNVAMNELISAAAGTGRLAQSIDAFRTQSAAVDAAKAKFEDAQKEATALADALGEAEEPTDEMAKALRRAQSAVESAGLEMQREQKRLKDLQRALDAAGVDVNDLAKAEERLTEVARETAAAQEEISDATGGAANPFGLTAQEATNLGYQINDIFTQLASGQSIFTTLAQQGPQIWQIEGVKAYLASLGPLIPVLLVVAAALATVAVGVSRVNAEAQELKQAQAYIATVGEAGSLSAKQIAEASIQMQDLGVKAEDARKALAEFNEGGLDPSYLASFTEAAQNASKVTGVEFTDAFSTLTGAMNGGYEEVEKLLDQFPVLTDAERVQIKAMFDSGRESEARRIVFEKFFDKMQDGAAILDGPFSNALKNVKINFNIMAENIAKSNIFKKLVFDIDEAKDALVGFNYLLLRARGLSAEEAGKAAVLNGGRAPVARPRGGKGPGSSRGQAGATSVEGQQAIEDAKAELDLVKGVSKEKRTQARLAKAERDARRSAPSGATDEERNTLAMLARQKTQRTIDEENRKEGEAAAKRSKAARDKAAREAQTLANKIAAEAEQLQSALDAMGAKVAKVSAGTLQEQLAGAAEAINKEYDKVFRRVDAFAKLTKGKGTIGGMSIENYRESVKANQAILAGQAQLKVYEDNINDTLAERKTLLADIEERAARGDISGAEAIRQTAEVTSRYEPIINNLTNAAVEFAKSIGGAAPSAELKAFIAKMQSVNAANNGNANNQAARRSAETNVGRDEARLNKIISQRNDLVASYNTLQELGLISAARAREMSAAAYEASKQEIAQASAQLRATLDAARMAMDPAAYDALIAKLQAIDAQAQYLDPRFAQLRTGIENIVSQNAMNGINEIAKGFGEAIAGTRSWSSALKNAGKALLNFLAQTLQMIAQLVIQAFILSAVDKATGGILSGILAVYKVMGGGPGAGGGGGLVPLKHNGGEIGSYANGQQSTTRVAFNPAMLSSLPRYHTGTPSVGLKSNESMAVLEKGERVVTEEQQRLEAAAQARQGGGGAGLRQVLAFGDDEVAAAMAGGAGERTTLTHLRRNAPLLKQLVNE